MDTAGVEVHDRRSVSPGSANAVVDALATDIGFTSSRRHTIDTVIDQFSDKTPVQAALHVTNLATDTDGLRLVAAAPEPHRVIALDPIDQIGRRVNALDASVVDGVPHYIADSWLHQPPVDQSCPYSVGAATRPIEPGSPNGDTAVITRRDSSVLVCAIDGLGHGKAANEAARAAREHVLATAHRPIDTILRGANDACRSTRGVVMALARFSWSEDTVTFGSVGNITTRARSAANTSFVPRRGVIGSHAPQPLISTGQWDRSDRMILHSDGVSDSWTWSVLENGPASVIAETLLTTYGESDDDATTLAVTPASDRPFDRTSAPETSNE